MQSNVAVKPKLVLLFVVGLAILTLSIAWAGEIRGTLTQEGKPLANTRIEITAGNTKYPTTTDKYGFYQVLVSERGACTITVMKDGQHPSATVQSFDRAVDYNLVLETKGAQYTLNAR